MAVLGPTVSMGQRLKVQLKDPHKAEPTAEKPNMDPGSWKEPLEEPRG